MMSTIAESAGIQNLGQFFNPEALQALTLVSGGVPRDFLTIFVNGIELARSSGKTKWLTPTVIYKGAGRLAYQTKLVNLKDDAGVDANGIERLFVDLLQFCLREKKKTAFLISQEDAQKFPREHEWIQQLMDFKLIHVVEPDTSAASGRPGRFEAYTLDFSLFMEPRRRGIEIVEFWKIDDNRRRMGIREAPVYELERARSAYEDPAGAANPEQVWTTAKGIQPKARRARRIVRHNHLSLGPRTLANEAIERTALRLRQGMRHLVDALSLRQCRRRAAAHRCCSAAKHLY